MYIERKLAEIIFTDIAGETTSSVQDKKELELLGIKWHIFPIIIKEYNV